MSATERAAAQEEFAQAAQEFVSYLEGVRNLSPNTVRAYRIDLEAYVSWLAREGVVGQRASHRDLRRYLADLTRAGYSTRTVNRHLSAVRGLYRWLVREGRVTADAAAALASPKIAKTLPRTMSDSDVDQLVAGCDLSDAEGLRDCAFLELLYATGARISEVHANFIVNENRASANDVCALMKAMSDGVYESTGIELSPEVRFLGFGA